MKTLMYLVWGVVTLVWVVAVHQVSIANWPAFSLDLSPVDEGTQSSYQSAVNWHIATYAVAAAVPPLLAFGLVRMLSALSGKR
ncbi:MAG: hypothetical protein AAFV45_11500 [Pseudomonadota bacterium]